MTIKPKPTGIVWDMSKRKGWGDRISWSDFDRRKLDGHTRPRVGLGDEIRSPMQSGRIGRFLVVEVKYPWDPPDMWFATVEDIGYVDDDSPPVTQFGVFGNVIA